MGSFGGQISRAKLPTDLMNGASNDAEVRCAFTRKLIWMIIFVGCSIIIILQMIDRISYYRETPLATNIEFIKNKTMPLPHVTLCPFDFKRPDVVKSLMDELSRQKGRNVTFFHLIEKEKNLTKLWDLVSYNLADMVYMCTVNGIEECGKNGVWKTIRSIRGNCFTYINDDPLKRSGRYRGMNLVLRENNVRRKQVHVLSWKVFIHSSGENPTIDTFTDGISVQPGFSYEVRLRLRKMRMLSTPREPCSNVAISDCEALCLQQRIIKNVNCRLPFMDSSIFDVEMCSTVEQFRMADEIVGGSLLNSSPDCVCVQECNLDAFDIFPNSVQVAKDPNTTLIRIFYDRFMYEDMREKHMYVKKNTNRNN